MMRLNLPYPISTNVYWRAFRGHMRVSREAKDYKNRVAFLAKESGVKPIAGSVDLDFVLHPKQNKNGAASKMRMDLDNALKVAIDALNGVAYDDDSQVVSIRIVLGGSLVGGGLSVWIKEVA